MACYGPDKFFTLYHLLIVGYCVIVKSGLVEDMQMTYIQTALTIYMIYCVVVFSVTAIVVTSWCKGYECGVNEK